MSAADSPSLSWLRQHWLIVLCISTMFAVSVAGYLFIQNHRESIEERQAAREQQRNFEENRRREQAMRIAAQEEAAARKYQARRLEEFRDELLHVVDDDRWYDSPDATAKTLARNLVTDMDEDYLQKIYDMYMASLGSISSREAFDVVAQSLVSAAFGIAEVEESEIDAFRIALLSTIRSDEYQAAHADNVIKYAIAALAGLSADTWRMLYYVQTSDEGVQAIADKIIEMATIHIQQSAEQATEMLLSYMSLIAAGLDDGDAMKKVAHDFGKSVADVHEIISSQLSDIESELVALESRSRQKPAESSAAQPARRIIGRWNDQTRGIVIEFLEENGNVFMRRLGSRGGGAMDRLTVRRVRGQTQYWDRPGNRFGDHYVIDRHGRLELRDSDGLIRRLNPSR